MKNNKTFLTILLVSLFTIFRTSCKNVIIKVQPKLPPNYTNQRTITVKSKIFLFVFMIIMQKIAMLLIFFNGNALIKIYEIKYA